MDIAFTIDDQDAQDAVNQIITNNGLGETPSDVIAGMIVPQLVAIRGQQLANAAQAKAAIDPDVLAFTQRQADKATAIAAAQAQPQPSPAQPMSAVKP